MKCKHNYLYGRNGYYCRKCGDGLSLEPSPDIVSDTMPITVPEITENDSKKREFLTGVIMGLGISLSTGFGVISVLLFLK